MNLLLIATVGGSEGGREGGRKGGGWKGAGWRGHNSVSHTKLFISETWWMIFWSMERTTSPKGREESWGRQRIF